MTNSLAWDYAIGMIKVDGLEPTDDFKKFGRSLENSSILRRKYQNNNYFLLSII